MIGAAGQLSGGSSYKGVAPKVKFVVLKVLDSQGLGSTSNVISAIQFATANKAALGIDIINLSLGHAIYEPAATDPLVQAVEAASQAGLVVVVSAGNYGTNTTTGLVGYAGITSPGNAPSAITVGAASAHDTIARGDDRIANYSSRGPTWYDGLAKPDVVATGSQLASNAAKSGMLYATYPALHRRHRLHQVERDEHGSGSGQRRRRADARGQPRRRRRQPRERQRPSARRL